MYPVGGEIRNQEPASLDEELSHLSHAPLGSKLAHHADGIGQEPHTHPNTWRLEPAGTGQRLVVGPSHDFLKILLVLCKCTPEPYQLLYVLSVPRGSEPGRYQMEGTLDFEELQRFVMPYQSFLEGDARHHLWIHSPNSGATLVYDKHNLIYAYGPIGEFISKLKEMGLQEGEFELPFPHYHNYFSEYDSFEKQIIGNHKWKRTPIVPGVDD